MTEIREKHSLKLGGVRVLEMAVGEKNVVEDLKDEGLDEGWEGEGERIRVRRMRPGRMRPGRMSITLTCGKARFHPKTCS